MSTVAASQTLKAVFLLEKDVNGDLLSWAFPSLDKQQEAVLKARSGLQDSSAAASAASGGVAASAASAAASLLECPFRFSRFGGHWLYQLSVPLDSAAAKARKITGVSVGIVTAGPAAFYVAKYHELCKLLLRAYTTTAEPELSPIPLMQIYLSVLTTNKFSGPAGSFDDASFDPRRAMLAPLKFLISTFGADAILIWIAMLLKKRVFVYHPRLSEVMNLVKVFPLLGAWHRQDVSLLRPYVNLTNPVEMAELAAAGVYVAGFIDPEAVQRKELYDLYIDASTKSFSFGGTPTAASAASAASSGVLSSPTAVASAADGRPAFFALTKFHRTTAESFVTSATSESEQTVIKTVATATKDLLDKVALLRADEASGAITQEGLANAGLPPAMQAWIWNVANAEGMTKKQ